MAGLVLIGSSASCFPLYKWRGRMKRMTNLDFYQLSHRKCYRDTTSWTIAATKLNTNQPTLLFLHGFPSTSHDWELQVAYFTARGYGVLAPDLLGYGGTSKPLDVGQYTMRPMVEDVIDILDAEGLDAVVGVAHDWGCMILSRLLSYHPQRLLATAFLAAGYMPPAPDFGYENMKEAMSSAGGYDVQGYISFFACDDAPKLCEQNIDSFYSLMFCKDPEVWQKNMAPQGEMRKWIEANEQGPTGEYLDQETLQKHKERLIQGGLQGPMKWYKARVLLDNEDIANFPKDRYDIGVPAFYGAALNDYLCLSAVMGLSLKQYAKNLTVKEFNTAHWIYFEAADELNKALEEFVLREVIQLT